MKYTIHRVKHSRYTHVVITHDLCQVDELIWNLAIPTGMILLDMKSCSQKILARFWEVKSEDNMLYWWRLRVVDQKTMGQNLKEYCDSKQQKLEKGDRNEPK
ncbi:hypothetical protein [Burkholderia cenocepacia]|uniref:hypothetical protein n=1 Tax=Burkholderia cenocepacia TaxID=95486 RepID=UPI0022385D71|nr:hypothetical protein [Burkholderia cenocepacia]MCW5156446.1 hypothetical protein [Burkholderia cenocepacia]